MTTRVGPNTAPKLAEIRFACRNLLKLLARRPTRNLGAVLAALEQATAAARSDPLREDEFLYINLPREDLDISVMEIGLTYSVYKVLRHEGIFRLEQLLELDQGDLLAMDHMGRRGVKKIQDALAERGWYLACKTVEPPEGDRWVEIRERRYLRSRTLDFNLERISGYLPGIGYHLTRAGFDLIESQGIVTIGELVALTETEFDALPWSDHEHRDAVKEALEFYGYEFKSPPEA
ncbi:MAG: Bacterial polymerase, alpha chain terminal domain [Candidatus Saccharibacteria bacterium]|nr:Bacterial polymerase, alpha chain terminal domain [Candidatus Saccharibacteria bacterium]